MKKYWRIILLCLAGLQLAGAAPLWAGNVIVVLSRSLPPYQEALKGFEQESQFSIQVLNLGGEISEGPKIIAQINSTPADGILVFGTDALSLLKMTPTSLPLVYTMVLEPYELPGRKISGVLMQIPINDQMGNIAKLFPAAKKVGVIYNPASSKKVVNQAREIAGRYGLILTPIAVENFSEIPGALMNITKDKVDVIWSVVDNMVAQPAVVGQIIQHSYNQKLPFIGLSVFHVKAGALVAFSVDYSDIGVQTAQLARKTFAGGGNRVETPRRIVIYMNANVQKQLGLDFSKHANIQWVN